MALSRRNKEIKEIEFLPINPKPMETLKERFIKVCLEALDTDVTPKDEVSDEVACAQVMSTLIKKVLPDFPIYESTLNLDQKMFIDKRFERILVPERGAVIISPRTGNTFGHVGMFVTSEKIASNTSKDGIFRSNYDYQSWISTFKTGRRLRIYIYRLKVN